MKPSNENFFEIVTAFLARLVMGASSGFLVRFISPGETLAALIGDEGLSKRGIKIFFELLSLDGSPLDLGKWFAAPSSNATMVLKLRVTLAAHFDAAIGLSAGEILNALIKGLSNKAATAGDWVVGFENESWGPHRSDKEDRIDYLSADFVFTLVRADGSEGAWVTPDGLRELPAGEVSAQVEAPRGKGRKAKADA